jgi:hypothetical protein
MKGKSSVLSGIAKRLKDQDPEIDEDENGLGYAANEFHFQKDSCYLSIRIAMKKNDKARIMVYNCDNLEVPDCPLSSIGILKKAY